MFLGQTTGEIKQDFQLLLPPGFREGTSDGVYITQGFERNLLVLPPAIFESLYQHLTSLNLTDPLARLLSRMLLGTAEYQEAGQDGNLSVPRELADFAELSGKIVIVGQGDFFELWSDSQWEGQKVQLRDFQANAQRFSALQLSTR